MFMKNFKLKFEQNWPKPLLITTGTGTGNSTTHGPLTPTMTTATEKRAQTTVIPSFGPLNLPSGRNAYGKGLLGP